MFFFVCFSPNFFILDEPTNHLDMETIEALGKALNKFEVSNRERRGKRKEMGERERESESWGQERVGG